MSKNDNLKTLQDLIDSDDELPCTYSEIPDVPAYKCDYRFDKVTFPWLKKYKEKQFNKINNVNTLYTLLNEETVYKQTKCLNVGETSLITKAVLSQEDIFCLRTIEINSCDATFLWLMNFLIYKDMQAKYKHLKGCLVDLHPYHVCDSNSCVIINKRLHFKFNIEQ